MISLHRFLESYTSRNEIVSINNSNKIEIKPIHAHDSNSENRNLELYDIIHLEKRLKEYQDRQLKELRLEMLTMIHSLNSDIERKSVIRSGTFTQDL